MIKVSIEKIRFHDLRHTYASLLIEQGENIKYIQSQLGHSNPTVTLDVYAHLMKPYNQESARKPENTVFGTTGGKMAAEIKKWIAAGCHNPLILLVRLAGFEPATYGLEVRCSIQLSYRRTKKTKALHNTCFVGCPILMLS